MNNTQTIYFVTSNDAKVDWAHNIMSQRGLKVHKADIDTDEIQALDVTQVAEYKAKQAQEHLSTPFFVEDTGLEVQALRGFPGALFKPVIETLGADRFIHLLHKDDPRDVIITSALVYVDPDRGVFKTFKETIAGSIPNTAGPDEKPGLLLSKVFVPAGYMRTLGELTDEELKRWSEQMTKTLNDLIQWLNESQTPT